MYNLYYIICINYNINYTYYIIYTMKYIAMNIEERINFYLGEELLKNDKNIHDDPNKMTIKNKSK